MPQVTTDTLPSLPAGYRWQIKYKRTWAFLTLQQKTWYGHRTVITQSLNPSGMTMQAALVSAANDILWQNRMKSK